MDPPHPTSLSIVYLSLNDKTVLQVQIFSRFLLNHLSINNKRFDICSIIMYRAIRVANVRHSKVAQPSFFSF